MTDDPAEAGAAGEPPEGHPDAETSIRDELSTVMPGKEPLANLTAVQTGPVHYTVLSARNGGPTTHRVNLQRASCTCEDMEYNVPKDESRDVCAHVVYCMLQHPAVGIEGVERLHNWEMMSETRQRLDEITDVRDQLEDGITTLRDAQADAAAQPSESASDDAESDTSTSPDVDPEDARMRLQGAYDDVVDDMNTKATQHYVWIQTGQDTPETLPGPGNVSVFEAFLQNADAVHYVPDDYEGELRNASAEKPGEWWKNAIRPEDVEAYISEVLE